MKFTDAEEQAIISESALGMLVGNEALEEVKARYNEPHRHYHDWTHALSVLSWVNTVAVATRLSDPDRWTLTVAALYHDAVYVVGAKDNERRSADLMLKVWNSTTSENLIMATAKHGQIEAYDVTPLTALMLDCDIATFGEPRWEVASWNDVNVQAELLQVYTPEQVRIGRAAFLQGMLAKRSIFLSDYFRTRYEAQARSNISRFIEELESC